MTDDKLLILRALSTLRQVRDAKLPELALLPSFHELIEDLTARLAQPEPEQEQRQKDMPCIEDDGCPTEKAVLQRFWRKHQQPEPEPVAWIHRFIEHGISIGKKPVDLDKHPDRWMPVYADPTPCQTCEALARTVMMDQTSHDTPPQREWQGLTDEEKNAITWGKTVYEILDLAEAKLKEKNNA